jgi:WD40 repeat protein
VLLGMLALAGCSSAPVEPSPFFVHAVHEGPVSSVAFTKEGKIVSGGRDGFVELTDLSGGSPTRLVEGSTPVRCVAASPATDLVVAGTESALIFVGSRDGAQRSREPIEAAAMALAFSPDGNVLAVGLANGDLLLRDVSVGLTERLFTVAGPLTWVAFSPDGHTLLAVWPSKVMLLDLSATDAKSHGRGGELPGSRGLTVAMLTGDGQAIVGVGSSGVLTWERTKKGDWDAPRSSEDFVPRIGPAVALYPTRSWSPEGVLGTDGALYLGTSYDVDRVVRFGEGTSGAIAVSKDGKLLASGDNLGQVSVWELEKIE